MAKAGEVLQILIPLLGLFKRKKLNLFLEDAAAAVEMVDSIKSIRTKVGDAYASNSGLTLDPFEVSELNQVFRYTDRLADRVESLRKK